MNVQDIVRQHVMELRVDCRSGNVVLVHQLWTPGRIELGTCKQLPKEFFLPPVQDGCLLPRQCLDSGGQG